tara:strand:- start:47219 stop:48136 length:918 start_codon:yes stop_codon:yes gene_type:complete
MKKITLLAFLFVAGMSVQAQQPTFTTANPDGGISFGNLDVNSAPVVITHSNTQNNVEADAIACASPTSFRNNNLFRVFDLEGDFGLMDGLQVTDVEFAIGPISTPSSFPITINIYSTAPGTFPGGTLTLQGTAVHTATNADFLQIVSLPLSALIPPGEAMVMEAVLIDDGTDQHFMRFGCNSDGDTGPSYIQADVCGAATPTPFSDLGLVQGLVWNVLGDDEPLSVNETLASQVSVYPNPATDVINIKTPSNIQVTGAILYDLLGKNTGVVFANGQVDVSALSRGVYMLTVETNEGSLTQKIVKR